MFSVFIELTYDSCRDLLQRNREYTEHFICDVLCVYVEMMYDSCRDSS